MTIHLVYPHDKRRRAKAPWSIGYNLATGLRKRGHQVRGYDWDEQLCVYPDGPDDILIGHPHPEPGKCFRTSMVAPWKKVCSIAPWNGSEEYRRDQEYVWGKVDHHFAICGEGWWEYEYDRFYRYGNWEKVNEQMDYGGEVGPAHRVPITRLDMAIDPQYFPPLKPSYNPPGERQFLYIGCTVPIKGTEYLGELVGKTKPGEPFFGHIGYGHIPSATAHGYLDLTTHEGRAIVSQYDFLIMPGIHDANPTTVLEAMAWGLIPVLSTGCGYVDGDYYGYKLARDIEKDSVLISQLQRADETTLVGLAHRNREMVTGRYTWQRFVNTVALVLEA